MRTFLPLALLAACHREDEPSKPSEPKGDTPSPGDSCGDIAPEGAFALDPDGPDTQIHVFSAPDASGVWVAWNRPDDAGFFDVWAEHVGCDGALDAGPFQLDDSADNETDPALAVQGDQVLVAWQSDNGQFPDNLDVRYRLVTVEGPISAVQEVPLPHNVFMPSVAATEEGWVLAAVHARELVFEVFTLDLDVDGAPLGEAVDLASNAGTGETWPDVALDEAGEVRLAWEVDEQVAQDIDGGAAILAQGYAPSLSIGANGAWLGWGDATGDLFTSRDGAAPTKLRGGDDVQHSLALAATGEGGLAGWMVNVSGLANRIVVGRFDGEGAITDQVDLGTDKAAPYGLVLSPLGDDRVFVGWSEGTSPAFRAMGAFIRLP